MYNYISQSVSYASVVLAMPTRSSTLLAVEMARSNQRGGILGNLHYIRAHYLIPAPIPK